MEANCQPHASAALFPEKNPDTSIYIYINQYWLVGWLVGNHLLLRDFGPYVIIFMIMCGLTLSMVMLLRDFGLNGIIFMI
jgi:hypothetical protein